MTSTSNPGPCERAQTAYRSCTTADPRRHGQPVITVAQIQEAERFTNARPTADLYRGGAAMTEILFRSPGPRRGPVRPPRDRRARRPLRHRDTGPSTTTGRAIWRRSPPGAFGDVATRAKRVKVFRDHRPERAVGRVRVDRRRPHRRAACHAADRPDSARRRNVGPRRRRRPRRVDRVLVPGRDMVDRPDGGHPHLVLAA